MFKSLRFALALFARCPGATARRALRSPAASSATAPRASCRCRPPRPRRSSPSAPGHQVQAVDSDSNYPTTGLPTKRINALNPSVEAVIGICKAVHGRPSAKPDLVIISYDANSHQGEADSALGVKVVAQDAPTSLAGALAPDPPTRCAHRPRRARPNALATSIGATITRRHRVGDRAHPGKKVTVYYELDPTYYSLT